MRYVVKDKSDLAIDTRVNPRAAVRRTMDVNRHSKGMDCAFSTVDGDQSRGASSLAFTWVVSPASFDLREGAAEVDGRVTGLSVMDVAPGKVMAGIWCR